MKTISQITFAIALMIHPVLGNPVIPLRALALAKGIEIPDRYIQTSDGHVPLPISWLEPGAVMPAVADLGELSIFEQITNERNVIAYRVAEKVKLPTGAKGILLLGWMAGDSPRYLAIDDDYLSAKHNDWMLINAADKAVAFQMGRNEKPVLIQPASVKKNRLNAKKNVGVSVIGQAQWDGKAKTFYSTYWPVRGGERGIVIFFSHHDRISLRKITDPLAPADPKTSVQGTSRIGNR